MTKMEWLNKLKEEEERNQELDEVVDKIMGAMRSKRLTYAEADRVLDFIKGKLKKTHLI